MKTRAVRLYGENDLRLEDFAELGKTDERFERLAEIVAKNLGLRCAEAEKYLLENF